MFLIVKTLFKATFLALHAFCKQVNPVLSQLKIQPVLSQYSLSVRLIFSDVCSGYRKGTLVQNKLRSLKLYLNFFP